ncbi:fumarate hydratase, class I, alpha subunit [Deferribacter desulfuricans SSM1]|uniref:Fumarate hydratase, class I, alpha subunit n=1 Tax=Deferribacter desulfuricans (strain DSM 14783 / JCM 11476 / NBRC 101012 / SSM1) TaxID=639282 RepID=D3PCR5_DEFDS|nr:fumarate hydratase [Deferribacter desulfuricans]BAI80388.1 fumarate hydratase, class I, alpha subunit [Deferribacter desulfuricans SSM1]
MELKEAVLELIRRAATDLPPDIEKALQEAYEREDEGTPAKSVFKTILENVKLARENSTPICQDTGSLIFYIDFPVGEAEKTYREAIEWAAAEATKRQYLRPNAVDPITGKNSGNNVGKNAPYIHFHQWDKDEVRIRLMLKGGGSENVGIQYKLPDSNLKAGRDLKGVKKVIIDAVVKAQGFGCAPGTIGVGIGGDRVTSYALSKEQFFRKLNERNPNPEIAQLEEELYKELNELGIGPMGFGGKTTVLGVHIDAQHRHPATYYVAISYMCWAYRRKAMTIKNGEVTYAD